MKWWNGQRQTSGKALHSVSGNSSQQQQSGMNLWKMITSAGHSWLYMLSHPVGDVENVAAMLAGFFTRNHIAAHNALSRLMGWGNTNIWQPVITQFRKRQAAFQALIQVDITGLWSRVNKELRSLRAWVMALIRHERRARRRADARVEHLARQLTRHALATVQREAASAYKAATPAQTNLIERLAGDLVTQDPLVKDLVGRLVRGAVDLAEVDDPLLRIALGFVMKEVINRLGIEKPIGDLLNQLLAPLLGGGQPKNLHAVILAICGRLNTVEGQWATFMQDGGPQILQAGEEWEKLSSLATDASLLAFFGAMVADPTGWAGVMSDVAGPVVGGAIDTMSAAIKVWR